MGVFPVFPLVALRPRGGSEAASHKNSMGTSPRTGCARAALLAQGNNILDASNGSSNGS